MLNRLVDENERASNYLRNKCSLCFGDLRRKEDSDEYVVFVWLGPYIN